MSVPFALDVEATGLHCQSFPISVAWGCSLNCIEFHVIRPEPSWYDDGYGWDVGAENIHGFTYGRLLECGEPADRVARRIAEALEGRTVLSDAPDADRAWLDKLHANVGIGRTYDLMHIRHRLPKTYDPTLNKVAYEALRQQAYARSAARAHTADGDVTALLTML